MRWWFVRHGQSTANLQRYIAGHRDVPLTGLGERQAFCLGGVVSGWEFERVLSSDLQRAYKTAELALPKDTKIVVCPDLRERSLGEWEGVERQRLKQQGVDQVLLDFCRRPPKGESYQDLSVRVFRCFLKQPNEPTVVFTHAGVIRCLIGLLSGHPFSAVGKIKLANTAVIERQISPKILQCALGRALSASK